MSSLKGGLLENKEYKGIINCFSRIVKEEGPLALYRGYSAYMVAILFWMSVLPLTSEYLLMRIPFMGEQKAAKANPLLEDEDDEDD